MINAQHANIVMPMELIALLVKETHIYIKENANLNVLKDILPIKQQIYVINAILHVEIAQVNLLKNAKNVLVRFTYYK